MPTVEELQAARAGLRSVGAPIELQVGAYEYLVQKRAADRTKAFGTGVKTQYYRRLFENALKIDAPYAEPGGSAKVGANDFAYWFNYYWTEARANQQQRAELWAPYSVVFDYEAMVQRNSGNIEAGYYLTHPNSPQMVREEFVKSIKASPMIARNVLLALFHLGFEEPPADLRKSPASMFYSQIWMPGFETFNDDGSEKSDFSKLHRQREATSAADAVRLAYRGDGRAKQMVMQHLGTRAKVDIQHTLKSMNMCEPWHPFASYKYREAMWMRRFSQDHDYESMTSVSQNFCVACAYPMVKLTEGFEGPPSRWSADKRREAAKRFGVKYAIAADHLGKVDLALATATNVYVINVTNQPWVVDTLNYSSSYGSLSIAKRKEAIVEGRAGYNERGIRGVGLKDLLAVFTCRRIHHPPPEGQAFMSTAMRSTVFLLDWEILPGVASARWGEDGYRRFVDNVRTFFMTHQNGFDITHSGSISARPTYVRIVEWDTPRCMAFGLSGTTSHGAADAHRAVSGGSVQQKIHQFSQMGAHPKPPGFQ